MGDHGAEDEALRWLAERVDDPVAPSAAAVEVADHRQPAGRRLLVAPGQLDRVGLLHVGVVAALDRGQPDLAGEHEVTHHLGQRLVRPVPVDRRASGHPDPLVVLAREALHRVQQVADVLDVVVQHQLADVRGGALPRGLGAVDPQRHRRVEVDPVGGRQPVAAGAVGGGAGRVPERPGEGTTEALDRVVAGPERHLGHRRSAAQLPGGPLQQHPSLHRDRWLPGAAGELAAEVVRRGVGVVGHLAEGVVVLVEDGVEELAEAVPSLLWHGTSVAPVGACRARPFLLRPSVPRSRGRPGRGRRGRPR